VNPVKKRISHSSKLQKISHERIGRGLAGLAIVLFYLLGIYVHPAFHFCNLFISINLFQSSISNKCILKNFLISLGFPGEREIALNEKSISPQFTYPQNGD
jgi:hypothetical protein